MANDFLNKQQLIQKVVDAEKQLPSEAVERALEVMLDELSTALICGDRVEIRGFGSLVVRKRAKGVARNPKNGEAVAVKDRGSLYFRASKDLIKSLNESVATA
jgi:integration host factor subunit beta